MENLEHPEVAWALETGYPIGNETMTDTPEERWTFAEVYAREFLAYLMENEPALVDGFIEENRWMYEDWLQ